MSRSRRILLCIAIAAAAFAAWELAGIDPAIPWHTISYFGARVLIVNVLVAGFFLVGGIGGFIWWEFIHMRSRISK